MSFFIYTPFKLSWVCSLEDFILYDNTHHIVRYSSIYRYVMIFLYRCLIYIILLKTRPANLLRNIIIFYAFQTPKSKYTWVPTRSLDTGINILSRIKKKLFIYKWQIKPKFIDYTYLRVLDSSDISRQWWLWWFIVVDPIIVYVSQMGRYPS